MSIPHPRGWRTSAQLGHSRAVTQNAVSLRTRFPGPVALTSPSAAEQGRSLLHILQLRVMSLKDSRPRSDLTWAVKLVLAVAEASVNPSTCLPCGVSRLCDGPHTVPQGGCVWCWLPERLPRQVTAAQELLAFLNIWASVWARRGSHRSRNRPH